MKKSYTLQYIDSNINANQHYIDLLSDSFDTIKITTELYETFEYYHHYKPDIVILSSNLLYEDYEPFLKKVKKNYSTPVIIFIEPKDVIHITAALNYNFNYTIIDDNKVQNIAKSVNDSLLKVKLIEKLLVGYNKKFSTLEKNKAVIENSQIPTLITTGHIEGIKCNKSFLNFFTMEQKDVNRRLNEESFIDSDELHNILKYKNITKEQVLKIAGKEHLCKIYILQKYELYLITFESLLKKNSLIDVNLKKDLETMLQRVDKNFDDYVKLQYNMIELSTQIKSFLNSDTKKSQIDQWLISNKKLVDTLEEEFDSNILEELKLNHYMNK